MMTKRSQDFFGTFTVHVLQLLQRVSFHRSQASFAQPLALQSKGATDCHLPPSELRARITSACNAFAGRFEWNRGHGDCTRMKLLPAGAIGMTAVAAGLRTTGRRIFFDRNLVEICERWPDALLTSNTAGRAGWPRIFILTPWFAIARCSADDEAKMDAPLLALPSSSAAPFKAEAVVTASVLLPRFLIRTRTRTERSTLLNTRLRGALLWVTGTPRRPESSEVLMESTAASNAAGSKRESASSYTSSSAPPKSSHNVSYSAFSGSEQFGNRMVNASCTDPAESETSSCSAETLNASARLSMSSVEFMSLSVAVSVRLPSIKSSERVSSTCSTTSSTSEALTPEEFAITNAIASSVSLVL